MMGPYFIGINKPFILGERGY